MIYICDDFELDEQVYQLRRSGEIVSIEPQVFKLLAYLITHRDRVVSREELFEKLWPGQIVGDAALTYCVAKARKAVQDTGAHQHSIKTVHGHGYRFIGQVASSQHSVVRRPEEEKQKATIEVHSSAPTPNPQHPTPALMDRQPVVVGQPAWPALRSSLQSRQLTLVGCLFVFGWVASLWQVSLQSPSIFSSFRTAAPQLTPELSQAEKKLCRWWALSTANRDALDSLLKGWEYDDRSIPEAKAQARWLFQRAIELDPTYAAAYASLGWMYWRDWLSWSPNPSSLEQASLYLQKAVALDSSCPRVFTLLAEVRHMQKRQAQALTEVERVIGANQTSAR